MLIAIDFDGTWTENPKFWREVIALGKRFGVKFICATGREKSSEDIERANLPMPIVFCGKTPKRKACKDAGYDVMVWIDDTPEMIPEMQLFNFNNL